MISLRERLARAMRIDTHTLPYRWSSNDPATRTPTFKLPDPIHSGDDFMAMLDWFDDKYSEVTEILAAVANNHELSWDDFRRVVTEKILKVAEDRDD